MSGNIQVIGDPDSYPAVATDSDGNSTVYAHNILILVDGSSVVDHVPRRGGYSHVGVKTANGSPTVFAHGKPVNYSGNADTCGHTRAGTTVPEVFVGDGSSSAAFIGATVAAPAELDSEAVAVVASTTTSYLSNPSAYSNPTAAYNGVKRDYAPVAGEVSTGTVAPSEAVASDIVPFLTSILAEAKDGLWRESGQGGKPSNKNITSIWREIGFPTSSPWNTDQTAWCMGFLNWVLKRAGYRWAQEAGSRSLQSKPERWNASPVAINDAQPGDLVLWNFGHVNFVYASTGGKLSFCGGNQTPTSGRNNNPDDGDVTVSWGGPTGTTPLWTASKGGITGIWRPSKT